MDVWKILEETKCILALLLQLQAYNSEQIILYSTLCYMETVSFSQA